MPNGSAIRFLNAVERQVAAGKPIHVVLDNYATHKHPKVLAWLSRHPRWTFHFTPTSASWLSPDERFGTGIVFGEIGLDGGLQVSDRAEDPAAAALPGHLGKEVLHRVVALDCRQRHLRLKARAVPSARLLESGKVMIENLTREQYEFEVAVTLHAAADHGAVEHAERGEQVAVPWRL